MPVRGPLCFQREMCIRSHQASGGGARETDPTAPIGEYAQSQTWDANGCFREHFAAARDSKIAIVRLNYAIASCGMACSPISRWKVAYGQPVPLAMETCECDLAGRCERGGARRLAHASNPPLIVNAHWAGRAVRAGRCERARRATGTRTRVRRRRGARRAAFKCRCDETHPSCARHFARHDARLDRRLGEARTSGSLGRATHFPKRATDSFSDDSARERARAFEIGGGDSGAPAGADAEPNAR